MVGIKDCLRKEEQQWRGERGSSILSEHEVSRLRLVITVVRSVQRYIPPLGPNGHKRAALPPMMGGTAALARAGLREKLFC